MEDVTGWLEDEELEGNQVTPPPQVQPNQVPRKKLGNELKSLKIHEGTILEGRTRQQTKAVQDKSTVDTEDDKEVNEIAMVNQVMGITTPMYHSDDPLTVAEALQRPDAAHWWEAMCKEFENLNKRNVGDLFKKSDVPKDRRLVGNRWVFKLKADGTYRARTVAKGFSQIPGVDFTENFAPVVNDVTFRIMLITKILFNLNAEQYDIETDFWKENWKKKSTWSCQQDIHNTCKKSIIKNSSGKLLLKTPNGNLWFSASGTPMVETVQKCASEI